MLAVDTYTAHSNTAVLMGACLMGVQSLFRIRRSFTNFPVGINKVFLILILTLQLLAAKENKVDENSQKRSQTKFLAVEKKVKDVNCTVELNGSAKTCNNSSSTQMKFVQAHRRV